MIKYSYTNLEKLCGANTELMLKVFYFLFSKKPIVIPNRIVNVSELKGRNFLLNPEPFIRDRTTDPVYKRQYLYLSSLRSSWNLKNYGTKYLDLSFFPDLDTNKILHNPLLQIKNDKLYFKFEE